MLFDGLPPVLPQTVFPLERPAPQGQAARPTGFKVTFSPIRDTVFFRGNEEKPSAENASPHKARPRQPVQGRPAQPPRINMAALAQQIKTQGVLGTMHGANPITQTYVFNVRNPHNFFDSVDISVVAGNDKVRETLKTLERHDAVLVKGTFINHSTPQGHIRVDELQVVKPWNEPINAPAGKDYQTLVLPDALKGKDEMTVMVHAVHADGEVLVVEYQDTIIPVIVTVSDDDLALAVARQAMQGASDDEVKDVAQRIGKSLIQSLPEPTRAAIKKQALQDITQDVWRGDKIKLRFQIQPFPKAPTHLVLDKDTSNGKTPLVILDRLRNMHNTVQTLEGNLVVFPKSPQINRDVYAMEQVTGDGTRRFFTLVNFSDMQDWDQLNAKLKAAWDKNPDQVMDARNKFINPAVKIRVTGLVNDISPNQANPQMMTSSKQVEVLSE